MGAALKNDKGYIKFDNIALAALAGLNAAECYGLNEETFRQISKNAAKVFSSSNKKRGVIIETDGSDRVILHVNITVKYGESFPAIAENIMDKVKTGVEGMTGLNVENVNVIITGIEFPD